VTLRDFLPALGVSAQSDAGFRTLSQARGRRTPLAMKFAAALIGLVVLVLLVNSAIHTWLAYNQVRRTALMVETEKASSAAARVREFLTEIVNHLGWTTGAEWRHAQSAQQRYDFVRLLRQVPAITELSYLDGLGHEQVQVSRLGTDSIGSNRDFSNEPRFLRAVADRIWFGPVEFRSGSEPYMTIAVAHVGHDGGVTVADVNLKLIWDVISAIRVGEKGYAFVVGLDGRLIAHPDLSLVLRQTDFSGLPQVKEALAAASATNETSWSGLAAPRVGMAEIAKSYDGGDVLTAYAVVPKTHWTVFVQQPLAEALAPVYRSLWQTLALLGLGLLLALVVGGLLARRMAAPLDRLRQGAERLGAGDLSQRIDIHTGDEIETLADQFNQMAEKIRESHETLEAKVESRTKDLNESLQQQTATADVLKVISRSAFDLQSVFDTLIASAVELSRSQSGAICVRDGEVFRYRASSGPGASAELHNYLVEHPATPGHGTIVGRAVLSRQVQQIPDLREDAEYSVPINAHGNPARALLGVPLLGKDTVEGAIVLTRLEPGAFPSRQIEILQTFADQAVIAIENVRLFDEVQTRTKELAASLDDLRKAQDRLIQSEKLASLGQLTAGIAHEIKNPLNFVNNFAGVTRELIEELKELVAATEPDPRTRREITELTALIEGNLDKVVSHGRRADSIVKNMLLHSRQSSGEHRLVDLNALVEESMNLAYHGARAEKPEFNLTLVKDLDPSIGEVDVFPQEFTRVLLNLISNGFYACAKRKAQSADASFEPMLAVVTKSVGDRVQIRIRDNGEGIPTEIREKIFNPFFTTKPAGEGTGLGLSLSYDVIVKQHRGEIEVTTEPGAFAEFTITIPRQLVAA
jgi:signal transduction histidine kinase